MKFLIVVLILSGLFLIACVENPKSALASATPAPAATLRATPTLTPALGPTKVPSSTPNAPVLPSVSIVPSANAASIPTLQEAALRLEPVVNDVFNVSRMTKHKETTFELIDANVWSMGDFEPQYVYTLSLSNARTHWLPKELLETATNASGVQNGYISYAVDYSDKANIMKCYGQRYEINLNLKGFERTYFGADYQPLIRRIMGKLVDVCPA